MLTEKLAKTLSEQQLRDLIKQQGKTANRRLSSLYAKGLEKQSGAYIIKTAPYLQKDGRTNKKGQQVFKTSMPKTATKDELVKNLLNIQYYNTHIGTAARVKKKAQSTAKRFGVSLDETREFWKLVQYGYNSVGYKIDSDMIQKIVSERMRAGQSPTAIKGQITRAANAASSGDDFISRFGGGGKWLTGTPAPAKRGKKRK